MHTHAQTHNTCWTGLSSFPAVSFFTLMETQSRDQINRNFHWSRPLKYVCPICWCRDEERAAGGLRLKRGSLSMRCNSRNDDWSVFEAHSIIASHQAPTSFQDVTISCAAEEQGGAGTVMRHVHQSPQRQQQKKKDRT